MTTNNHLYNVTFDSNAEAFIKYFETVPDEITRQVNKGIPSIQKNTRKIVRQHLTKGNGRDTGVYKKHIVIRDLTTSTEEVHFQVGGSKKHYRLTHLLEHGHHIVVTRGDGVQYCLLKSTKAIPHIAPGQEYADKEVVGLYEEAIEKSLERKV